MSDEPITEAELETARQQWPEDETPTAPNFTLETLPSTKYPRINLRCAVHGHVSGAEKWDLYEVTDIAAHHYVRRHMRESANPTVPLITRSGVGPATISFDGQNISGFLRDASFE